MNILQNCLFKVKSIYIVFSLLLVNFCHAQLNGGIIDVNDSYLGSTYNPYLSCQNTNLNFSRLDGLSGCITYNLGGTPPYTFVWQYDSSGVGVNLGVWWDIPNSNSCSIITKNKFNRTRYRRKVTDNTGAVAYSNILYTYTCTFDAGNIYNCTPTNIVNIAIGFQPPSIIGNTATVSDNPWGIPVSATDYSWYKSSTGYANSFLGLGGQAALISHNPTSGSYVSKVYYKRAIGSQFCFCGDSTLVGEYSSLSNVVSINFLATHPFNAGTITSNVSNAIIGDSINFNNVTIPSGGTPTYYYQWQDSVAGNTRWSDIAAATSSTYQTILSQHKYFRRRVQDINCNYSFSGNQYLRTSSTINSFTNTNVNSYTNSNVNGNYWYTSFDASENTISSIYSGTNNLGTVTTQMKYFGITSTDVPTDNSGISYMPKYFEISSSSYPSGNLPSPVKIRLFFKNLDFTNYKTKIGNNSLLTTDLRIMHYHGVNQDCDFNNNSTIGGTTQIQPTVTTFADGFYLTFTVNSLSEFGVVAKDFVVPVNWSSFYGEVTKNQITLNWVLQNQYNNSFFEVERSEDGLNFITIGKIIATISQNKYQFVDISALTGNNFYRIKQVDKDGSYAYSKSILIKLDFSNKISIYPNPSQKEISVQTNITGSISYKIINIMGAILQRGITSKNKTIDLANLQSGTYLLQLDFNNQKQVIKLVKN